MAIGCAEILAGRAATGIDLDRPRTTLEVLFFAERIVNFEGIELDKKTILDLTRQLIAIYDKPFWMGRHYRELAAEAVVILAGGSTDALDLVIANARQYADMAKIDDADPYSPNSFEVLAQISPPCSQVLSFLQDIIRTCGGIAQWEANRALCGVHSLAAGL
jgi:hypothetical protein